MISPRAQRVVKRMNYLFENIHFSLIHSAPCSGIVGASEYKRLFRFGGFLYFQAEGFTHFHCNEVVAGCAEVDAVSSENSFGKVIGVVRFEVIDEGFAEVDHLAFGVGGDFATDRAVFVEHGVAFVGSIIFLTDDSCSAKNHSRTSGVDFRDDVLEAGFESFGGGAACHHSFFVFLPMPDVVDADVDENDGRFFGDYVFFKSRLKVGNFIAADSGADDFNSKIWVRGGDRIFDESNITTRFHATCGDGVAEEDDAVVFFQRSCSGFCMGGG